MQKSEPGTSRMCDVYCSMKELKKIDALKKCEQGYESPKWVCLLKESVKKFDVMREWLTDKMSETFDFTHSDLDEKDERKQSWIWKREDTILSFSESILMTQVFFPGPVFCCKHVITDMEHLNVICNHCRHFQMYISTSRPVRVVKSEIRELKNIVYMGYDDLLRRYDDLLSGYDTLFIKYADLERKIKKIESSRLEDSSSDSDEGEPSASSPKSSTETEEVPTAYPVERIPEAEKAPEGHYTKTYLPEKVDKTGITSNTMTAPTAKLEVQNLLRMLQNAAY